MKIGLISDTHHVVPSKVYDHFKAVDLIIHAGDIGSKEVITDLEVLAPVRAVYGNVDTFPLTTEYNRIDFFRLDKYQFCLTHYTGSPKQFAYQLFKMDKSVDVVISGHTHRKEKQVYKNILFVNPGSVSQPRYELKGSLAIMELNETIDVQFYSI